MSNLIQGDCLEALDTVRSQGIQVALTFLDPPFNQGKEYAYFDDDQPEPLYWEWLGQVCRKVYACTEVGGALYLMHREKNAEWVLRTIRETGWTLQNLIVWLKKTSAVPNTQRFGKQYQIIAFATKGARPRCFHRLRIDLPPEPNYKFPRADGVFVTDCWSDIRELTSGYFAGDEAIRNANGERVHKQQSPVALLLRILLSSTKPNDWVLDPFAGTGTTAVVAEQLGRHCIAIEVDPEYARLIQNRLRQRRAADCILRWRDYYRFMPELEAIWPLDTSERWQQDSQPTLFGER